MGPLRIAPYSFLLGMKPPVRPQVVGLTFLQGTQRQNRLRPFETPPLAFPLPAVFHHRPAGRLHHPGGHRQAGRQVLLILHLTAMVVEEANDGPERLATRRPELPFGQGLFQAPDDVAHPPAQDLSQLRLHPQFPLLRAFLEEGVGSHPQVADHRHEVEDKRHVHPALKALAHQTPQT